jgi:hypothetical protein
LTFQFHPRNSSFSQADFILSESNKKPITFFGQSYSKFSFLQAFMFESSLSLVVTDWANRENVDEDYHLDWAPLQKHFGPKE